ncbi:uncharacterized protein [Onthophagus taurus]|uniref:uncharacterized protein n=1 Tax=Onthophagus taurus TaxID=166361 RepID=UPI0039BE4E5E
MLYTLGGGDVVESTSVLKTNTRFLSRSKQIEENPEEYSIFDNVEEGICDIFVGIKNSSYKPIDRARAIKEMIQNELNYHSRLLEFIKAYKGDSNQMIASSLNSIDKLTISFIENLKDANYDLIKITRVYEENIYLFKIYLDILRQTTCLTDSIKSRTLIHATFLKILLHSFNHKEEEEKAIEGTINIWDNLINGYQHQLDISYDIEKNVPFSSRGKLVLRLEFKVDKKDMVVFLFEKVLLFTTMAKQDYLTYKKHYLTSNLIDVEICDNSTKLILSVKDKNNSVKIIKFRDLTNSQSQNIIRFRDSIQYLIN